MNFKDQETRERMLKDGPMSVLRYCEKKVEKGATDQEIKEAVNDAFKEDPLYVVPCMEYVSWLRNNPI